jgi:RNA polymerase sigma-70 factor (ECF subfamily)
MPIFAKPYALGARMEATETRSSNVLSSLTKSQKNRVFEQEFYPVMDALYNFAFRLTLNEDDANDLVQETYLKAYRFIESYQSGTNAKAWLFRILKNSFINDFRKKSKEPDKTDYDEVEQIYNSEDAHYSATVDLRSEVFSGVLGDELTSALNQLPVDFRLIILLSDIEGFTYEEMSKIIGIPIGTVRSRLHRARNMLKDSIKEYARRMGYKVDEA